LDDGQEAVDNFADLLQAKSRELVDSLQTIICNKTHGDAVNTNWSKATQKLCLEFFSPADIRRFLEYFWSLWFPNCPIVHKPLFEATSVSPALLFVMTIIGACLSPNTQEQRDSTDLA
jgi:hypothetical protein